MARKRGEPALPATGREQLEAPVYTDYPTNTPGSSTTPAEDPLLNRSSKKSDSKKDAKK
jgi:hypothetical protein